MDGDRNTKFFHALINIRRRNNFISSITLDLGLKIWERYQIGKEFLEKFKLIYSMDHPRISKDLKEIFPSIITKENNDLLTSIPSFVEK